MKVHVANEMIKNASAASGMGTTSRAASRTNLLDSSNGSGSHSSSGSGSGGIGGNRKRSTSSLVLSKGSGALEVFNNGNGHGANQALSMQQPAASPGMDQAPTDSQLPPVVVHCSSGAGRTGVYLLTEVMIHALQHNQVRDSFFIGSTCMQKPLRFQDLDMARALALLRQKRMLLVQTFPQYRFVFTCIAQYMRKSRLI